MTWCSSPRWNARGTIRRRQTGGSISWSVTRIWTAVGNLNTILQYVPPLPNGDRRLLDRHWCRLNVMVDGVTNSFLKQSAAFDQRSEVDRVLACDRPAASSGYRRGSLRVGS